MKRSDRKKQLIAQGALYRAEILHAKQSMGDGLRPDSLARGVFNTIAATAFAVFRKRSGAGFARVGMETLLPLLTSGAATLVKKKSLLKPVLRGTLIVGAVAAAVALIARRKKSRPASEDDAA